MTRATGSDSTFIISVVPLFHRLPARVMWADTDPAGIVWFGVFCRYFENAEEDLFRRLGRDRTTLLAELGIFMPRTSLQSRFRSPARLGEAIAIGVGVGELTERRVGFAFEIHEAGTDRLICEASYRVACVDAASVNPPRTAPTQPLARRSAIAPQAVTTRTSPSCAVLATSRPSRENTLPRPKPRAPEALGLSSA